MRLLVAYDGDHLPIETWHLVGTNSSETLCGMSVRPIRWRFADNPPVTGGEGCDACRELESVLLAGGAAV